MPPLFVPGRHETLMISAVRPGAGSGSTAGPLLEETSGVLGLCESLPEHPA